MKLHYLDLYNFPDDETVQSIKRVIGGDLSDPWTRQEMHLWLDQMINEMIRQMKEAEPRDEDPR